MSEQCGCGNCGCGAHNDINQEELEKILEENKQKEKNKQNERKYAVEYRINIEELECEADEFIDRIKSYAGIVDEVEFTEEELIISYDDRLITPSEISDLVH